MYSYYTKFLNPSPPGTLLALCCLEIASLSLGRWGLWEHFGWVAENEARRVLA